MFEHHKSRTYEYAARDRNNKSVLVVLGVRSITVNFPLVPMNDSSKYNSKWQKADFYSNLTFCLSLVMLYMYEYMQVYCPVTMPTAETAAAV